MTRFLSFLRNLSRGLLSPFFNGSPSVGDSHPSQWSTTAASNTTVGGGVNIAENCPMPGMNNAHRAEMAGVVGALTFQATSDSLDVYTATLAPAPDAYVQKFPYFLYFGTANTTTTPTLNLNSLGAKTIVRNDNGGAVNIGDLNGAHILVYDGTNMRLVNPIGRPIPLTNSLSGDVSLSSTSSFFDGPSVAQGTSGTWFASGKVTVQDASENATYIAKLWDGTTVIDSAEITVNASGGEGSVKTVPLSGFITSPAANIKISVKNTAGTTGKIIFNASGLSKDSTLTVVRIA